MSESTSSNDAASLDIEALVAQIREAAAAARDSGVYPAGLEEQLASDFARQIDRPDPRVRFNGLRRSYERVEASRHIGAQHVPLSSGLPGGDVAHKAVAKVVSRQVNGVYRQLRTFTDELVPLLDQLIAAVEDPPIHVHDDVLHDIDVVKDRLGDLQRTLDALGATFADSSRVLARMLEHLNHFDGLEPRLRRLEERERRRSFDPSFDYGKFEDTARGSQESIRDEYADLADSLRGSPGPVVDIGAGRGELLQLLNDRGVDCWGVELDADLAERGRRAGLDLRHGDGIDAVREQPLGSLGAIVSLHVIEHLTPNELLDLVHHAHRALASGGRLILETPNPQSLYIYARAFWLDPTHVKPIHPSYIAFVLGEAGFRDVAFEWVHPPATDEQLIEVDGDSAMARAFNENVRRTNNIVFAPQDYRVTAIR